MVADNAITGCHRVWLAYMDILGYRRKVEAATDEAKLLALQKAVRDALDFALGGAEDNHGWDVRVFSDTIIVGLPKSPALDVLFLLGRLAFLQSDLVLRGLLVRGAIADGWYCDDGLVIVSPALTQAYQAENKLALYPRIILTDEILQQVRVCAAAEGRACGKPGPYLESEVVWVDDDGIAFVNYISVIEDFDPPDRLRWVVRHKGVIEQELAQAPADPRVHAKLHWLAAYHNKYCAPRLDEEFRESGLMTTHRELQAWTVDPPERITRDLLDRSLNEEGY